MKMTVRNILLVLVACASISACGNGGGLGAAGASAFGVEGFDPTGRDLSGTPRTNPTTIGALESS